MSISCYQRKIYVCQHNYEFRRKKVNHQICVHRECIYCYKVLSLTAKYININIKYKINSGKNMVSTNEKL